MKLELPGAAERAISCTRPYKLVYAACRARGYWLVVDPGTGDVALVPNKVFKERFSVERECPPAVRLLFDGMPAYTAWRWGEANRKQRGA